MHRPYWSEVLDHLGLVAGIFDELGIGDDAVGKTTTGGASWLLPCRRCIPWRMCLGSPGSAGHACAGTDGPVSGARERPARPAPSASRTPRSVQAAPALPG